MRLPNNTRIRDTGYIEFRKQYRGQMITRTWPAEQKEKAFREIYDLLAKMAKGEDIILAQHYRMLMEEACDVYLRLHGPSLKGGVSDSSYSPYYNLRCRLSVIKEAFKDKFFDAITKFDVRDFLARFDTVGTRMKYLGTLTHMYKFFAECNEEGTTLKAKVLLPPSNPASKWRAKMKAAQKNELPRTRVLSPQEWQAFRVHLTDRARAVCEMALRRFLRKADIEQISHMSVNGDLIEGLQQKTGERFSIPTISGQPVKYDLTNFEREFYEAQVTAKMDYPKDHPLHFTLRDLRRTGATWAYNATKDLVGISKMLGHTKITTTIRYLNIDETNKIAIAEAVDKLAESTPELGEHLGESLKTPQKSNAEVALKDAPNRPVSSVG